MKSTPGEPALFSHAGDDREPAELLVWDKERQSGEGYLLSYCPNTCPSKTRKQPLSFCPTLDCYPCDCDPERYRELGGEGPPSDTRGPGRRRRQAEDHPTKGNNHPTKGNDRELFFESPLKNLKEGVGEPANPEACDTPNCESVIGPLPANSDGGLNGEAKPVRCTTPPCDAGRDGLLEVRNNPANPGRCITSIMMIMMMVMMMII